VTCIAHWNGIGFDIPVLKRVWGIDLADREQVDGMLLSRLYNPSRAEGHALASYGVQFGYPKGDFKDFDCPAEDETEQEWLTRMAVYCAQDTRLNTKACQHLQVRLHAEHFDGECVELEHQVAAILTQQRFNGFKLDIPYVKQLYRTLMYRMSAIDAELQTVFPPIVTERYSEKTGKRLKDGVEVFNIGSRQQIAKRLGTLGAKFPKKTEKGSVIVDETTLKTIDLHEAALVLEYLTLQKRTSQINSWLEVVAEDGRVHGRVNCNGAVTGRMTHSKPNMAQIPGVKQDKKTGAPLKGWAGYYGYECRQCWIVDKGNKLVGIDASGLELRMLAHYMKDEEYIRELLEGDIHTANQNAAGLETRSQAKTFIYAFLYGAGNAKIGSVVGGNAREGGKLKERFLKATPALAKLKELISDIAEKSNSVPGLDGRRLRIRHQHAALNTLLQGAGAVVMKKALVIFQDLLDEADIKALFVVNCHDEWQLEVEAEYADEVGRLGCRATELAGEHYNMRCPLAGDYHVGDSWAETH
jgi:DNA polymerase I-like protein with 3'-5' exonuclease and polymerase domains